MTQHLSIAPQQSGIELDEFLCRTFPLLGKRFLRRAVREGRVLVNGAPAAPGTRLSPSEVVSVGFDAEETLGRGPALGAPEEPPRVLFEDEHLLIVDKPAGLPVEPDRWDPEAPCLIGALQALAGHRAIPEPLEDGEPSSEGSFRPRLVHRLDKDTSGCVLVAKTIDAERALRRSFDAERAIRKTYLALVEGEHPLEDGRREEIRLALGPERGGGGRQVVRADGREAVTSIAVRQRFRGYTLLECEPRTGRTHQIRVHLAASGFPLAVDPLYGRRTALFLSELKRSYRRKPGVEEAPLIARLTLHALALEFPAVAGGSIQQVESPLPRDLERTLKQLGKVRPPRR